ncbi:hypothetical protein [Fredinandcohnia onubensis]|uniref:hypothetical protein n=1 Tax=Fredinandcohnia onubensis TaxID=1571209 RepID=UPI000C0BDAD5|nr:hypothetical protein [Fredinandcohnia onubensis]
MDELGLLNRKSIRELKRILGRLYSALDFIEDTPFKDRTVWHQNEREKLYEYIWRVQDEIKLRG